MLKVQGLPHFTCCDSPVAGFLSVYESASCTVLWFVNLHVTHNRLPVFARAFLGVAKNRAHIDGAARAFCLAELVIAHCWR